MTTKKSNKTSLSQTDTIVTNALMVLALIASSFIIMIAVFITAQGILPLISNNRGLGSVNLWHFFNGHCMVKRRLLCLHHLWGWIFDCEHVIHCVAYRSIILSCRSTNRAIHCSYCTQTHCSGHANNH